MGVSWPRSLPSLWHCSRAGRVDSHAVVGIHGAGLQVVFCYSESHRSPPGGMGHGLALFQASPLSLTSLPVTDA